MEDESRIPPALVVALVVVTLAVGLAAYYMGRFGRLPRNTPAAAEVAEPAAPVPIVAEAVATPAEMPPTITPAVPVVIENGRRPAKVLVERSSQIVVSVPTPPPPTLPAALAPEAAPTPSAPRRIVIEVQPTPTPTAPELELEVPIPPPPEEIFATPEPEPPPEETPEPVPTAALARQYRSVGVVRAGLPGPLSSGPESAETRRIATRRIRGENVSR